MDISFSFIITTLAGLSTLLGTIIIFIKFKDINKIIVSSLSFSSSIMLSISILDLFPESIKFFNQSYNILISFLIFLIFFITGNRLSYIINKKLPKKDSLYNVGLLSTIILILHNIPEGILTFMTSSLNKKLGLSLAIAIAMHNIPEGISISVPIYYSSYNKKRAFLYTLISAISEPLGAFIAYVLFYNKINNIFIGILLSLVSGIMLNISIFELIPEAKKYKENKLFLLFFLLGTMLMIINLFK